MGAISKPTHDQNAANNAIPDAPAPNTWIAAGLSKIATGLSGASEKPSAPPLAKTPAASTTSTTTSATSATPSTFAVSSMWNQANAVISASPTSM